MKKVALISVICAFSAAGLVSANEGVMIFLADASDQTLIICTLITMFGVLITALVALYGIRATQAGILISQSNAKALLLVSSLPEQVEELSKGIDGVAHELKAAKEEGAVARVEAADAKGQLKERDRTEAAATEAAVPAPASAERAVDVIVKNDKDNAANVRLT